MGFMGLTFSNSHGVRPLGEMQQAETSGNLEGVVLRTHDHRIYVTFLRLAVSRRSSASVVPVDEYGHGHEAAH
jgi:hypothetical protein